MRLEAAVVGAVRTMLRIDFIQQWFTLSDQAMEKPCTTCRCSGSFARPNYETQLPDESTIVQFRHLLEKHKLAEQILATFNEMPQAKGLLLKADTVADSTLIAAPNSTKKAGGKRDLEMVRGDVSEPRTTEKGNQWHFGMKTHIGVDSNSGLIHTVRGTAANVSDVVEANGLLHDEESRANTSCLPCHRTRRSTSWSAPAISAGASSATTRI